MGSILSVIVFTLRLDVLGTPKPSNFSFIKSHIILKTQHHEEPYQQSFYIDFSTLARVKL